MYKVVVVQRLGARLEDFDYREKNRWCLHLKNI